ncbi:MAG: topoisomerase DNA-binding C4 zinc finger domain-containing protein [Planctomycetes bacterium]|nr:topoisomerase DNA-binding C4 zinc finger domain-containing protein [Planctomycetota bacterium]
MIVKLGRMGKFLSCSDYPTCKFAKQLGELSEERKALIEKYKDQICPDCNSPMTVKASRYGDFLACSAYPKCKKALPIVKSSGVTCPVCTKEELVEKKGRARGRIFWGCNGYPDCDYISNSKPVKNGEDPKKGFYIEKKGEVTFFEFDLEKHEEQKRKAQERKEKIAQKEKEKEKA